MVTDIDQEPMQTDLSTPLSMLEQKDRIQILLSEYSYLCSEMRSLTSYEFQVITVAAAVYTWFIQQPFTASPHYFFWLAMVPVAATFGISVFIHARDLKKAASRVKELEHEINSRAGEYLLVWETLWSPITRMGLIRSFFSMVGPLPRSQLPPLESSFVQRNTRGSN